MSKLISIYNKIKAKGQPVQIKRKTSESFNSITRQRAEGLKQIANTYGVKLKATGGRVAAFDNLNIESTYTYKRFWKIPAYQIPFEPRQGDQIFDEYEWTIAGCTPIYVNGEAVLYNIGVYR